MDNKELYQDAIEYAAIAQREFLEANEANLTYRNDREFMDFHWQLKVKPAADASVAQQDLIRAIFGVSEEKVHEDIMRFIDKH